MRPHARDALLEIGAFLKAEGYGFVTVTPDSHRRVLARGRGAQTLRDVFGWNLEFEPKFLPDALLGGMQEGGWLESTARGLRSLVRFSTVEDRLLAHSGYPTEETDAVFLGPDTYRFCRALRHAALRADVVIDVGCGTGIAGMVAGAHARRVILADISDEALAFAELNVQLNGVARAEVVKSDVLGGIEALADLIVANPPYMQDPLGRIYRDGGGAYGEALAVRIVRESLFHLRHAGRLLLYTGAAVVDGEDQFLRSITPLLDEAGARFRYEELDPDVFGEELSTRAYDAVDRIAAVLLDVTVA